MFNARHYMQVDDAYFTPELQNLDTGHPHHFTLDFDQLDRTFEYPFIQSESYSFPATSIELERIFDTLGFL